MSRHICPQCGKPFIFGRGCSFEMPGKYFCASCTKERKEYIDKRNKELKEKHSLI